MHRVAKTVIGCSAVLANDFPKTIFHINVYVEALDLVHICDDFHFLATNKAFELRPSARKDSFASSAGIMQLCVLLLSQWNCDVLFWFKLVG